MPTLSTLNSTDRDVYVRTEAFAAAYLYACPPSQPPDGLQQSRPSTMFPNTSFATNYGGEMTTPNCADMTIVITLPFLGACMSLEAMACLVQLKLFKEDSDNESPTVIHLMQCIVDIEAELDMNILRTPSFFNDCMVRSDAFGVK
jgi:hypothetical protein